MLRNIVSSFVQDGNPPIRYYDVIHPEHVLRKAEVKQESAEEVKKRIKEKLSRL